MHDGGAGGGEGEAGAVDHRPRLAPGQVDVAGREPNVEGFPLHAVAGQSVAEQSRRSSRTRAVTRRSSMRRRWSSRASRATTANPTGGEILKDKNGKPTGLMRETAPGLIRRPAVHRGRNPPAARARRRGSRSRRASPPFRTPARRSRRIDIVKKMIDEGRMRVRLWMMIRAGNADAAEEPRRVPRHRLRQQPAHGARDQGDGRRRARIARRVAARAVRGQARQHGPRPGGGADAARDRADRPRSRHAALRARDRRPRQSRGAEHLRGGVQEEHAATARTCAGASSTRSTFQRRRHPALRPARRDRVDAGHPLHVGRHVGARPAGRRALGRRRLRLAEADEVGRRRHQRHRRAGRERRSDSELLRGGDAQARRTARRSIRISG